jgi:hypothetical protein
MTSREVGRAGVAFPFIDEEIQSADRCPRLKKQTVPSRGLGQPAIASDDLFLSYH